MEVGFKEMEWFPVQYCCLLPRSVGQQCRVMDVRSDPQGRKNASSRSSLQGHSALHVSVAHFAHERDCALPHGLCNETVSTPA